MSEHRYAEIVDLTTLGIPAAALLSFSDAEKNDALEAASSLADGYIATKHTTPLTVWPKSLTLHVAREAADILMRSRGMNPNAAGNELIMKGHDDAKDWFIEVSKGIATLPKPTAPAAASVPQISSSASRYG